MAADAGRRPTPGDAREVLLAAKDLERRAGRRHGERFGPRPLDIDLLLYGDLVIRSENGRDSPELILPHPRMRQRRFVLEPLACLLPELRLPPDGAAVQELLETLGPEQRVERIDWSPQVPIPEIDP